MITGDFKVWPSSELILESAVNVTLVVTAWTTFAREPPAKARRMLICFVKVYIFEGMLRPA